MEELREYEQFMNDFVAACRQAKASGKTVDQAEASIEFSPARFPGYRKERYKAAIQAIYDELK